MAQKYRVYSEWANGPYGSKSPLTGEYNSVNAQVYKTGAIGVRPGWKTWTLNTTALNQAADIVRCIVPFRDTDNNDYVLLVWYDDSATTLKGELFTIDAGNDELDIDTTTDLTSANVFSEGTPAQFGGSQLHQSWYDGVQAISFGGRYFDDYPSSEVTMTGAPGDSYQRIYRDRMYLAGVTANPARVYYSDAADFTNFTSTSFFDLHPDSTLKEAAVCGMWSTKNSLLINTRDGRWFSLTGASPETGTLREIDKGPTSWQMSGALLNGNLFYPQEQGKGIIVASPAGLNTTALAHMDLRYMPVPKADRIRSGDGLVDFFTGVSDEVNEYVHLAVGEFAAHTAVGEIYAVDYVNGVWNFHRYEFDSTTNDPIYFARGSEPNLMWMVVQDDATTYVASRNICLDRPARETDTYSQPTANTDDGSACLVDVNTSNEAVVVLGDITHPSGGLVKPLSVVLDLEYWRYDFSNLEYFGVADLDVDVEVLGLDNDSDAEVSATTQSFNASTDGWEQMSSSQLDLTEGIRRRIEVPIEDMAYGNRIRVTLKFNAMAIHRATVYYDEQEARYP